ncbi:MAG TPA: hypothetical protein VMY05_06175 [Acidobacteriota bacterium]|nr:hypothetical protein [Acidobacteriota bacterium]
MKSWPYFIWLKRLLPLLLALVIWQGYVLVTRLQTERQQNLDRQYALVTADIWIATARFRDDPQAYMAYRDSVLAANGLSAEQMFAYLERHWDRPEEYHSFVRMLNEVTDSLGRMEDSLSVEAESLKADSAAGQ